MLIQLLLIPRYAIHLSLDITSMLNITRIAFTLNLHTLNQLDSIGLNATDWIRSIFRTKLTSLEFHSNIAQSIKLTAIRDSTIQNKHCNDMIRTAIQILHMKHENTNLHTQYNIVDF